MGLIGVFGQPSRHRGWLYAEGSEVEQFVDGEVGALGDAPVPVAGITVPGSRRSAGRRASPHRCQEG